MVSIIGALKDLVASKKVLTAILTVVGSLVCRKCKCDPAWIEQVGMVLIGSQGLADFGKHRKV